MRHLSYTVLIVLALSLLFTLAYADNSVEEENQRENVVEQRMEEIQKEVKDMEKGTRTGSVGG